MPDDTEETPAGHLSLRWSAKTHPGSVRQNNEDSFLALTFDGREMQVLGRIGQKTVETNDCVFAVSDGMGGAKSGEFASRLAIDGITRLLPKGYRLSAAGLSSGFSDLLQELFIGIHQSLTRLGFSYEECQGMGATLSLCWFTPEWMFYGHIGDSRIYYLPKGGSLKQLSHDHTHVGWLFRNGSISEREARDHPRKSALQQALGANTQFIEPQIGAVGLEAGDRFLICSDGLIDGLWDRHLEEALSTEEPIDPKIADHLVQIAVENSGKDNCTAMVIEVATDPLESI
ncbi:MAG: protein phosphatase 2C domain-containing protein [Opitutaceae bacterium]